VKDLFKVRNEIRFDPYEMNVPTTMHSGWPDNKALPEVLVTSRPIGLFLETEKCFPLIFLSGFRLSRLHLYIFLNRYWDEST